MQGRYDVPAGAGFGADLQANNSIAVSARAPRSLYRFECVKPDGTLRWAEDAGNLVVTAGLNDLLDKYFKGSSYTAAFYVGLKGSTHTPASSETIAAKGWTESTAYSNGSRPSLTLGTVASGSVDNSTGKAAYTINQTATIYGAFVVTGTASTQINSTQGTLYGAADFATPSSSGRSVVSGDTLNVTVTLTASTS